MLISIDIDDTIRDEEFNPIPGTLEAMQELLSRGHHLIYWTARPEIDRLKTTRWLEKHGYPNAPLFMGKPQADIYVDDRAVSNFQELDKRLRS